MTRDIERHIFALLQRRQESFVKILAGGLTVTAILVAMSLYFQWPVFLALLPIALFGPFAFSVINAHCPRCSKPIHRNPLNALRPLTQCSRCGYRG